MYKILGMARYEAAMYWRRRGMRVVLASLLIILAATVFILLASTEQIETMLNLASANEELVNNTTISFMTAPLLLTILIFILPVIGSDSIPLDQQEHTGELLDALPLSQAEYLAGKVGGLWLVMALGMLVVAIVHALLWRALIGEFDLPRYSEIWIAGLIVMLLNGGLGVLLAALQPTRIRAALLVMGVLIVSIFVVAALNQGTSETLLSYLDPSRFTLLNYFLGHPYEASSFTRVTSSAMLGTLFIGLLELAVVFGGVWAWRRQQERIG